MQAPLGIAGYAAHMSATKDEGNGTTQTLAVRFGRFFRLDITARTAAFVSLMSVLGAGVYGYKTVGPPTSSSPAIVTAEWKASVDKHIGESASGYARIAALENWACRFELRFLQQNRWEATRANDPQRVFDLDNEIKRLEKRSQCE